MQCETWVVARLFGIQFMQNEKGIIMQHSKYLQLLLELFRLEDCKPLSTPMELGLKLSMYYGNAPFDATIYSQAMGCLIYLCNTMPDVQYAVSYVKNICTTQRHNIGKL